MNKENQIEELAKVLSGLSCTNKCKNCNHFYNKYSDVGCVDMNFAEKLYAKGYRKASEVAREIFEELDKRLDEVTVVASLNDCFITTFCKTMEKVTAKVEELKKKYTESEKDDG